LSQPVGRFQSVTQRFGVAVFVALVLALLWSGSLWLLSLQKQRLIDESRRELGLLNDAAAQHMAGVLNAAESDLRMLDFWLRHYGQQAPLNDPRLEGLVGEVRRASGGLSDVRLVAADGRLFTVPHRGPQAGIDVSDREYFRVQQQAIDAARPATLHIGVPAKSRVTGRWVIPLSWRLSQPVAGFTVLVAVLEVERLVALHEGMRFKPEGTVVLVRTDGMSLSRTPFDERFMGRDVSKTANFVNEYGNRRRGSFLSDGRVTDGVPRVVSHQRLDDYPVIVMVTREVEQVLAQFNGRRPIVLAGLSAVSLVLLAFAVALHQAQRALLRTQAQLQHLAATDELTDVLNRRALGAAAERELARARRNLRPLAVLALDLDHFKQINDEHGHGVGDRVLRECANRWRTVLRAQDLLGRLGGEEFCVVLPETDLDAARQVAERLRLAVAGAPLRAHAQTVTTSIGLSLLDPTDARWDDVLERADRALYQAKFDGRNRVSERLA
jgi:diguanylate cyclase (GGDEF)-like protein